MKHLLLTFSLLLTINSFAQEPNPDLFQTWYLYSVRASDGMENPYVVSEIEPSIAPNLTIMQDLTFYGTANCNTFNGSFNVASTAALETDQFSHSTVDCDATNQNDFENEYFSFI